MQVAIQGDMRAAVAYRYGGPEVVTIQQLPIPVFQENEVLVEVHFSTVNRTDCGFRQANYVVSRFISGLIKPKRPVWGSEFYGRVVAAGSACQYVQAGDYVVGFDDAQFGGHAEYKVIAETASLCKVEEQDGPDLAALLEGGHYALSDIKAAQVKPGDRCLVYGASGTIGSAAVQLLKAKQMRVIAVCLKEHLAGVRSLGADEVWTSEEYRAKLDEESLDFLFDAVGKLRYSEVRRFIKPSGCYISTELGRGFQNPLRALFSFLLPGPRVRFPIPQLNQEDAKYLYAQYQMGLFKPLIDCELPLAEIREAYHHAESGMKQGSILLRIKD